ncbi:MAG: hypothetical protein AAFN08_14050 [Cyanobacteria bacterium J06559_3]
MAEDRDAKGRYQERPDSLSSTIGLRLPKSLHPFFASMAATENKSIATLAREIVVEWMEAHADTDEVRAIAEAWLKAQKQSGD